VRRGRWSSLLLLLCLSISGVQGQAPGEDETSASAPTIVNMEARRVEGRAVIQFELEGVVDEEMLEQIHSGIAVKFRHRVELIAPKRFLLSPRNVVARSVIETRVAYDALTERYELKRRTELKKPQRKGAAPPYEEISSTSDIEAVLQWMTRCSDVVLFDSEKPLPEIELRVRIESSIGRKFVLWLFPARIAVRADTPLVP